MVKECKEPTKEQAFMLESLIAKLTSRMCRFLTIEEINSCVSQCFKDDIGLFNYYNDFIRFNGRFQCFYRLLRDRFVVLVDDNGDVTLRNL